jgi:uncharacterized metal-binding protein YceD (DUF177 family)
MTGALKTLKVRLSEMGQERTFTFEADDGARAEIAATLGLVALPAFQATATVRPWLDGAELTASWRGEVVQTCGVSLEHFETALRGDFTVRVVPQGSPNAPAIDAEIDLDPEAEDAPDVLETDQLDIGAYLVEHLSLEIDPFPRKPGAVFEPPEAGGVISPFASLKDLKS